MPDVAKFTSANTRSRIGTAKLVREYIAKLADFAEEAKKIASELLTPERFRADHLQNAKVKVGAG